MNWSFNAGSFIGFLADLLWKAFWAWITWSIVTYFGAPEWLTIGLTAIAAAKSEINIKVE